MTRRHYDWPKVVARLRAKPNVWMVIERDVPARIAQRVNVRGHPALQMEDGMVKAVMINQYMDEDTGHFRGDLVACFIPGKQPGPQPPHLQRR
jgi:bifunctional N-acetylglucosamine-1-phosphate-uridyltransferase/glucosamine-1-phosphate-acetyltransferase GlmU-like protein